MTVLQHDTYLRAAKLRSIEAMESNVLAFRAALTQGKGVGILTELQAERESVMYASLKDENAVIEQRLSERFGPASPVTHSDFIVTNE